MLNIDVLVFGTLQQSGSIVAMYELRPEITMVGSPYGYDDPRPVRRLRKKVSW